MKKWQKASIASLFILGSVFYAVFFILSYHSDITHPGLTIEAIKLYNKNTKEKISPEEMGWIRKGSIEEDKAPRWINHFYDPIHNTGLKDNLKGNPAKSAVEWAHSSTGQTAPLIGTGDYTWEAAIYYYQKGDKEKAYIALGHILHLIEDMAVPAHTRNDAHPEGDPYENWAEGYAMKNQLNFSNVDVTNCTNLDQCFHNLALYTNTNFFSKSTISSKKYNFPNIIKYKNGNLKNGDIVKFGYNKNGVLLIIADAEKNNWRDSIVDVKFRLVDEIHQAYWDNLAPKAVSYAAGVIQLFHQEAQQKSSKAKPISWWKTRLNIFADGVKTALGFGEKAVDTTVKTTKLVIDAGEAQAKKITDAAVKTTQLAINEGKYQAGKIAEGVNNLADDTQKIGKILGKAVDEARGSINPPLNPPLLRGEIVGNPPLVRGEMERNPPLVRGETGGTPPLLGEDAENPIVLTSFIENKFLNAPFEKTGNWKLITYDNIKYVIDGDTIELDSGEKVRYIGIDAPELNKKGSEDDECMAWQAKERNEQLLKSAKDIWLVSDRGADKDKYGRLLRYVYANTLYINKILAEEGLAKPFICASYMENCPVMKDKGKIGEIVSAGNRAASYKRGIYSNVCENKKIAASSKEQEEKNDIKENKKKKKSRVLILGGPVITSENTQETANSPNNNGGEENEQEKAATANNSAGEGEEEQNEAEGDEIQEENKNEETEQGEKKEEEEEKEKEDKKVEEEDNLAPNAFILDLKKQQSESFEIFWEGEDSGDNASGIDYYDISYKNQNNIFLWFDLETATSATSTIFAVNSEMEGDSFCFRARAADKAGNIGAWTKDEQIKCTKINLTLPSVPKILHPLDGTVLTTSTMTANGTADLDDIGKKIIVEIASPNPLILETIIDENGAWKIEDIGIDYGIHTISAFVVEEDGDESEKTSANFERAIKSEYLTVIINEIAWMGTAAGSSDEWIELYNNTGFNLSLNGWKIQTADGSLSTVLEGEIKPYGYYLLERTDDNTISDIAADMIYSGNLHNDGEILQLRDADNNVIDHINCSLGWFAGDNSLKSTMERINPLIGGEKNNWADSNIQGTPKSLNSASISNGINPHQLTLRRTHFLKDFTFTREGSPYLIDKTLIIKKNIVVAIEPGVVIKAKKDAMFRVDGTLNVNGTEKWPVVFTSINDQEYGGETGNKDDLTGEDWVGISFVEGSTNSNISHAVIRYAGGCKDGHNNVVKVNKTNVDITDSLFEYNKPPNCVYNINYIYSNSTFKNNKVKNNNGAGIGIIESNVNIENNVFENNSHHAVITMGHVKIKENEFINNSYAIQANVNSVYDLQDNIFQENKFDGIYLYGDIKKDTVVPAGIYKLKIVTVKKGAVLTIQPGAIFKNDDYSRLEVYGKLIAEGAADNKIIFTSFYYDSEEAGGDTNNDGDDTTAKSDDWRWIMFDHSLDDVSILDNVIVKYGGYYTPTYPQRYGQIKIYNGHVKILNSEIIESTSNKQSISLRNGILEIENSIIGGYTGSGANHSLGLYIIGGKASITNSVFLNSLKTGILGNNSLEQQVNAQDNWWGRESGPDPEGSGVRVIGNVDYSNWKTEEP